MPDFPAAMPHGALEEIVDGVFWVRGKIRFGPGVWIPRNMVVVRSGDELSVISAVRLDDDGEQALARLGKVRHVIKLGYAHGLDDPYYVSRFEARYWALPGGARPHDPKPTDELGPGSTPIADADAFRFELVQLAEGALLVRRDGGLLVTCDAVQNWPDTTGCNLLASIATRVMGFTSRPAQIGKPWRKAATPKGGTLKPDFDRLAALEFRHLIGAHGAPLRDTAKTDLAATVDSGPPD